jgi:ribosomal protein S18 acetylase RimI-like enzyme
MNGAQYVRMRDRSLKSYAEDMVRIGVWSQAEAMEKSREDLEKLLPSGAQTPDQHLFAILTDEGVEVGAVWYGIRQSPRGRSGFIWWLEVFEAFRRKGYAESALREIEKHAASKGAAYLGLNVFSHDQAAVDLYRKMGYEATSFNMEKKVFPPSVAGR